MHQVSFSQVLNVRVASEITCLCEDYHVSGGTIAQILDLLRQTT